MERRSFPLQELVALEAEGKRRGYRHDGKLCYTQLWLNGTKSHFWCPTHPLSDMVTHLDVDSRHHVLSLMENANKTAKLRDDYAHDFPAFPLLDRQPAVSLVDGVYFFYSDTFLPYVHPPEDRIREALKTAYAVKSVLPEDVTRLIHSFAQKPLHPIPHDVVTFNMVPLVWWHVPSHRATMEDVPNFALNLQVHGFMGLRAHQVCAVIGEMMECARWPVPSHDDYGAAGVILKHHLVINDPAFLESPLYHLLCTVTGHHLFVHHVPSNHITGAGPTHFYGPPSHVKEHNVIGVIRLCAFMYQQREWLNMEQAWITTAQINDTW